MRGNIKVRDTGIVRRTIKSLLGTIRDVVSDAAAVAEAEDDDTTQWSSTLSCLDNMDLLLDGPALDDAVVVLYLFRNKLNGVKRGPDDAVAVLQRLDEHLQLLGITDVSCLQMCAGLVGTMGCRVGPKQS